MSNSEPPPIHPAPPYEPPTIVVVTKCHDCMGYGGWWVRGQDKYVTCQRCNGSGKV